MSPGKFNRVMKTPVIVPITNGGSFARSAGFTVSLSGAGIQTTGVVLCSQPRALDVLSRGGRKIESLPADLMDEVRAKLLAILD